MDFLVKAPKDKRYHDIKPIFQNQDNQLLIKAFCGRCKKSSWYVGRKTDKVGEWVDVACLNTRRIKR